MNKLVLILFAFTSVLAFSQKKKNTTAAVPFSTKNKTVTVYTSADSTNLRLSKTNNIIAKKMVQATHW